MSQTSIINQRSDSGTTAGADRPFAADGNRGTTADGHHATDVDVETLQNQLLVRPNSQFSERSHKSAAEGNCQSTSGAGTSIADGNSPGTSAADGNRQSISPIIWFGIIWFGERRPARGRQRRRPITTIKGDLHRSKRFYRRRSSVSRALYH